eukprot:4778631-Pyramimonas_sp.AAC.1
MTIHIGPITGPRSHADRTPAKASTNGQGKCNSRRGLNASQPKAVEGAERGPPLPTSSQR